MQHTNSNINIFYQVETKNTMHNYTRILFKSLRKLIPNFSSKTKTYRSSDEFFLDKDKNITVPLLFKETNELPEETRVSYTLIMARVKELEEAAKNLGWLKVPQVESRKYCVYITKDSKIALNTTKKFNIKFSK